MTVRELLEQLQRLAHNHGDAPIVCSVGVLKGIVQRKLKDDDECFPGSIIYFSDDAVEVRAEENYNDVDGPLTVVIHAGADLEIPEVGS
jgi:hypothetical protein